MRVWPTQIIGLHVAVTGVAVALGAAWAIEAKAGVGGVIAVALLAVTYLGLRLRRYVRRYFLLRSAIAPSYRQILRERVPYYRRLDAEGRARFEADVRIFLAEQRIVAAKGARLDDVTRVLIAASAAMLGHGRPDLEWPNVRDIVVYPRHFDEDYTVGEGDVAGMVHAQGPVVFSQQDLKHGFRRPSDGHNVGVHELAHVLDMRTGAADGLPHGLPWVATAPWIEVISDRIQRLRARRYKRVLRSYAGTNPAEFFAVAVEAFFEQPARLKQRDAELYGLLVDYFGQDPGREGSPTR